MLSTVKYPLYNSLNSHWGIYKISIYNILMIYAIFVVYHLQSSIA